MVAAKIIAKPLAKRVAKLQEAVNVNNVAQQPLHRNKRLLLEGQ